MEARLILKGKGEENTLKYQVIEAIFAFTFLFMRLVGGGFLSFNVWASDIDPIVCLSVSGVVAMGWYWSYIILIMMAKKAKDSEFMLLRFLVRMVEQLRMHPVALQVCICLGSIVFPMLCGRVWKLGYLQFKVGEFQVI